MHDVQPKYKRPKEIGLYVMLKFHQHPDTPTIKITPKSLATYIVCVFYQNELLYLIKLLMPIAHQLTF